MRLPDFLIIGAARSGTTALYSMLQQHPQVFLPARKRPEPHFFLKEEEYRKGIEYYSQRWFADVPGSVCAGEASTSYICHEHVAARIKEHLPDVRAIALLRDPAERAFSGYWHTKRSGLETLGFEEAISQEPERLASYDDALQREIRPHAYLERGFYHRQLSDWLRHLPTEQVGIWLFEDLVHEPDRVWTEVLEFLGVRSDVETPEPVDLNPAVPPGEALTPDMRTRLIEIFRDDIEALEGLIGRDLSSWLS